MNRTSDETEYQEREEIDYIENDYPEDANDDVASKKSLKIIFAAIIAILTVLVLILAIFFGIKKAKDGSEDKENGSATTLSDEESTSAEDEKDIYSPGYYTVASEGSVRLREDHSLESEKLKSIPRGKKVNITEIFTDEKTDNETAKYWGKTEFEGVTGWVCIAFLTKDGDNGTPVISTTVSEKETTTEKETEETTTEKKPEETTAKPEEKTTVPEPATEGSSSLGGYTAGKYSFSSSDSSLHMRDAASIDGSSINDIPSGSSFNVTEIREDPNATSDVLRYWGKISYNGIEGWVCMGVLNKG